VLLSTVQAAEGAPPDVWLQLERFESSECFVDAESDEFYDVHSDEFFDCVNPMSRAGS